jgi:hypothetical protein
MCHHIAVSVTPVPLETLTVLMNPSSNIIPVEVMEFGMNIRPR